MKKSLDTPELAHQQTKWEENNPQRREKVFVGCVLFPLTLAQPKGVNARGNMFISVCLPGDWLTGRPVAHQDLANMTAVQRITGGWSEQTSKSIEELLIYCKKKLGLDTKFDFAMFVLSSDV